MPPSRSRRARGLGAVVAAFKTRTDIGNRALQHLRLRRVNSFTDHTLAALELGFAYDRLRETELKEHLWRFATRRTVLYPVGDSTYVWTPPDFNTSVAYALGQVVVDKNGDWWQAKQAIAAGTSDPTDPTQYPSWRRYYGPDTMTAFVTNTISAPAAPVATETLGGALPVRTYVFKVTYLGPAGESAASSPKTDTVAANNLATVTSPAAATGVTRYNVYAGASEDTVVLQNASPINIGTDWIEATTGLVSVAVAPATVPNSPTAYYAGDLVSFNGLPYLSLVTNNQDTPPSTRWVAVNGTISRLMIVYPIGTGPINDARTANIFRLPHGYLRQAPTQPKRQASVFLGAIQGNQREDWVFEGNYLISAKLSPVAMRYVADMADVSEMDASFCEMLSARIAQELGPVLIADPQLLPSLLANAKGHYERERRDATAVNAIEIGPLDFETDDYISCRF